MDDFLIRALIGGLGLALVTGPFGCLVVWQRMSYFGAALSHAALLGITLGLLLQINLQLSILLVSVVVSLLLMLMYRIKQISTDTALGIVAHALLALGLVVVSTMPTVRLDLFAYLFGDILTIGWHDIAWIYGGGTLSLLLLALIWRPLLSLTIQRELALVDGVHEQIIGFSFLLLLSIVVALAIQVVGALLIVSLLIIPAATARRFAHSPERMALLAAVVGILSVVLGLSLSLLVDAPSGPAIVVGAALLFLLTLLLRSGKLKRRS